MPIKLLVAAGTSTVATTSPSAITWPLIFSTLGGVALTGAVTVVMALVQKAGVKQQAETQEKRELAKWQRELRRQAYADCIVAYEKVRDVLAPLSDALGPRLIAPSALAPDEELALDDLIKLLHGRYEEAFQRCQVVRLEGPAPVAASAQGLLLAMGGFLNVARERVRAAKEVQNPVESLGAWTESAEEMHTALEDFMAKASAAVGSN